MDNASKKPDSTLQILLNQLPQETNEKKRRRLAIDIIDGTALEAVADLIPFLDDSDLLVQEHAAETLGRHRYEPAIPLLIKKAQRETTRVHNARIGAILALGRMKSFAGFAALIALSKTVPAPFHNYFYKALELHGCRIKFENGQWKYEHANQWQVL